MSGFEEGEPFSAEEIREAEDMVDLSMPDLMAKAAEVQEWNQTIAFNFIRRAYLRGKGDVVEIMREILESKPVE